MARCRIFCFKFFVLGVLIRLILMAFLAIISDQPAVKTVDSIGRSNKSLRASVSPVSYASGADFGGIRNSTSYVSFDVEKCTMSKCFNFSRCDGRPFKVHVYPTSEFEALMSNANSTTASTYAKIVASIVRSGYYTSEPAEACLFVVAYDTLDRDLLSSDYIKNLRSKFATLPNSIWNDGQNHLIFNLYPGTWPDYEVTDLGFDTGRALLAKASFSVTNFRPDFDVSLPLFHRILPLSATPSDGLFRPVVSSNYGKRRRRYLFSFKGKRYVHGIGSETRNSLYHLHDGGEQSVILTTCRHGKNWHQVKDERCEEDNDLYDKWTYDSLLSLSDFCLIPRGRRLGSYRFLEALQYGCIPTILANDWELPFSELVSWSEAAVWSDERLFTQIPVSIESIPAAKVFSLRRNAKRLSDMYFASVERIVSTTLEIVKRRLRRWELPSNQYNLEVDSGQMMSQNEPKFEAIIVVSGKRNLQVIRQLIDTFTAISHCSRISILCVTCGFLRNDFPVSVSFINASNNVKREIWTVDTAEMAGLFWIDATGTVLPLNVDEVEFAWQVWRWFPKRLVGFITYRHTSSGRLSSKLLNDFSFLSGSAILYHKSYNKHLIESMKTLTIDQQLSCFDRMLNRLATQVEGGGVIKLTARTQASNYLLSDADLGSICFGNLTQSMLPKPSVVRFDPILYKDSVSNLRKRYRQMELL